MSGCTYNKWDDIFVCILINVFDKTFFFHDRRLNLIEGYAVDPKTVKLLIVLEIIFQSTALCNLSINAKSKSVTGYSTNCVKVKPIDVHVVLNSICDVMRLHVSVNLKIS